MVRRLIIVGYIAILGIVVAMPFLGRMRLEIFLPLMGLAIILLIGGLVTNPRRLRR